MLSDDDAGFLGSVAYEMQLNNYPQTADLIRGLVKRNTYEATVTLPGPDGFPNETVSAEKFSHLTTEWDA